MGLSFSVPQVMLWQQGGGVGGPPTTVAALTALSANEGLAWQLRLACRVLRRDRRCSFSSVLCSQGKAIPSSLRNMYKELKEDLGCQGGWLGGWAAGLGCAHSVGEVVCCGDVHPQPSGLLGWCTLPIVERVCCAQPSPSTLPPSAVPKHGNLEKWAHQGVLLLNAGVSAGMQWNAGGGETVCRRQQRALHGWRSQVAGAGLRRVTARVGWRPCIWHPPPCV